MCVWHVHRQPRAHWLPPSLFAMSGRETVRVHAWKNQTVIARARCRISTRTRWCVHSGLGSLRLRPRSLEFVPRMRERGEAQRRRRVRDARRCAQRRVLWSGRGELKHISEDAETKVRAGSGDGSGRALRASQCFQCFWAQGLRTANRRRSPPPCARFFFSAGRLHTPPCAPVMDRLWRSAEEDDPAWTPTSPPCFEKMGSFYIVEGRALL